jgi:hypothetical protein
MISVLWCWAVTQVKVAGVALKCFLALRDDLVCVILFCYIFLMLSCSYYIVILC